MLFDARCARCKRNSAAVLGERSRIAAKFMTTFARADGISVQMEVVARTMLPKPSCHDASRRVQASSSRYPKNAVSLEFAIADLQNNDLLMLERTARRLQMRSPFRPGGSYGTFRTLPLLVADNLLSIETRGCEHAVRHGRPKACRQSSFRCGRVRLSVQADGQGFDNQLAGMDGGHFG